MQITDLVRDSPLRDLGTILSQCTHVVVPRDEQDDSFEYDPKEEVDSDESDEDYVPGDGSGGLGESDGEGGEIQKEGVGEIQKEGCVKFRKRGG